MAGNIQTKNFHTSSLNLMSAILLSKSVYFEVYYEVHLYTSMTDHDVHL